MYFRIGFLYNVKLVRSQIGLTWVFQCHYMSSRRLSEFTFSGMSSLKTKHFSIDFQITQPLRNHLKWSKDPWELLGKQCLVFLLLHTKNMNHERILKILSYFNKLYFICKNTTKSKKYWHQFLIVPDQLSDPGPDRCSYEYWIGVPENERAYKLA